VLELRLSSYLLLIAPSISATWGLSTHLCFFDYGGEERSISHPTSTQSLIRSKCNNPRHPEWELADRGQRPEIRCVAVANKLQRY
jgi:hypothetical protein